MNYTVENCWPCAQTVHSIIIYCNSLCDAHKCMVTLFHCMLLCNNIVSLIEVLFMIMRLSTDICDTDNAHDVSRRTPRKSPRRVHDRRVWNWCVLQCANVTEAMLHVTEFCTHTHNCAIRTYTDFPDFILLNEAEWRRSRLVGIKTMFMVLGVYEVDICMHINALKYSSSFHHLSKSLDFLLITVYFVTRSFIVVFKTVSNS